MLRNGGGILFPSIILSRALHVKIHIFRNAWRKFNANPAIYCRLVQISANPPPIFAQKFAKELYLSSYNQSFPKIDKNVSPTRN